MLMNVMIVLRNNSWTFDHEPYRMSVQLDC